MPVLPDHEITALLKGRKVKLARPEHVQPGSLDLTTGSNLGQLTASPSSVEVLCLEDLDQLTCNFLPNTSSGWTISPGQVWYSTGATSIELPDEVWGRIDPKSSMGRIDLHVQSIVPGARKIGEVPLGYQGTITHLLTSQSFHLTLPGRLPVSQLRLYRGEREILRTQQVSLSLKEHYVAQPTGKPLVLEVGANNPDEFFRAKHVYERDGVRRLILEPGQFLLATTCEGVSVAKNECAELVAIDLGNGQLIIHYAGFIDPGFGLGVEGGNVIVLEIRNMGTTPIELAHGQTIGTLVYEALASPAKKPYGSHGNNYHVQRGLELAKFFERTNRPS